MIQGMEKIGYRLGMLNNFIVWIPAKWVGLSILRISHEQGKLKKEAGHC
jgi:hypothetical protein